MRKIGTHLLLALLLVAPTTSCGSIFFPERRGQETEDRELDPNILILDGLGLLLFIVPGLIAYGVDFYTGAVYLPDGVDRGEGPFIRDDGDGGLEVED